MYRTYGTMVSSTNERSVLCVLQCQSSEHSAKFLRNLQICNLARYAKARRERATSNDRPRVGPALGGSGRPSTTGRGRRATRRDVHTVEIHYSIVCSPPSFQRTFPLYRASYVPRTAHDLFSAHSCQNSARGTQARGSLNAMSNVGLRS
jgi:hypothetical protein